MASDHEAGRGDLDVAGLGEPTKQDEYLVLLRVVAELFYRSSTVRRYLKRVDQGNSEDYSQLIAAIGGMLDWVEEVHAKRTLRGLKAVSEAGWDGEGTLEAELGVLSRNLKRFSRAFVGIHETLVYLPRHDVLPEAYFALGGCFDAFYRQLNPTIILGRMLNAIEFDVLHVFREDEDLPNPEDVLIAGGGPSIVLQLPVADSDSPAAWAVLAHEMGHAIDRQQGISKKVADRYVTDQRETAYGLAQEWCGELAADLIAASVMGPAPILSLVSMEYCLHPLRSIAFRDTRRAGARRSAHPPTRWRLALIEEFVKETYGDCYITRFVAEERKLYEAAWAGALRTAFANQDELQAYEDDQKDQYYSLIRPWAIELQREVSKLGLPVHKIDEASLLRCLDRLNHNLPISGQGVDRSELNAEISAYREKSDAEGLGSQERVSAFRQLAAKFVEQPLDAATILLAGLVQRNDVMRPFITSLGRMADEEEVSKLCTDLRRMDVLILGSIRTSSVHWELLKSGRVRSPRVSSE